MKVKTLSALAGLGGALILSGESQAAYIGLGTKLHTTVTISGVARDVYRVYAVFSEGGPDLWVTALGGSVANGAATIKSITLGGGAGTNFFNAGGGNSAPGTSSGAFVAGPNAQWDTFATIGADTNDLNDALDDETGLSPGFPTFISSNVWTGNFAWFTAGPKDQGKVANGLAGSFNNAGVNTVGIGVLIAQLTVTAGQHALGTIFVNGTDGTALAASFTNTNQTFDTRVPAPGALALLGLAGLVGTRRRRA
jgi:MYXO-CTERM domain-containing protein